MKYSVTNDQLLLLGSLLHYDHMIGIENSLENTGLNELGEKWRLCEEELTDKGLLHYTENHNLSIDKHFFTVLVNIMDPDIVFIIQDSLNEKEIVYFYIKNNCAAFMKVDIDCTIEAFEELTTFLSTLSRELGLCDKAIVPNQIEKIPSNRIGEIELKEKSKVITGVRFTDGIDTAYMKMRAFSDETTNYLIKHNPDEQHDEVILVKGNEQAIISQIFAFD